MLRVTNYLINKGLLLIRWDNLKRLGHKKNHNKRWLIGGGGGIRTIYKDQYFIYVQDTFRDTDKNN